MKKVFFGFVVLTMLVPLAFAGGGRSQPEPTEMVQVWRGTIGGGRLVNNLNPHTISSTNDSDIANFMYTTLLIRNPRSTEWEFIPCIA